MQSHQDTFGAEASKRYGHRRTPTLGKAMPVTSLLLHFPPPTMSTMRSSCMRDGRTPDEERPPLYFQLESPGYGHENRSSMDNESRNRRHDDIHSSCDELNLEQEYDLHVSECSSGNGDGGRESPHNEHQASIVGNSVFYTPCMTCTDNAPGDMGTRATAINEMCRRLCTDECRLRLSLAGFEPPSAVTLKSREALSEYVKETCLQQRSQLQHTGSKDPVCAGAGVEEQKMGSVDVVDRVAAAVGKEEVTFATNLVTSATTAKTSTTAATVRPPSCIAIQRKKFLTDILTTSSNDTDSDSSFVDEPKEKVDAMNKPKKFVNNLLVAPARELVDETAATIATVRIMPTTTEAVHSSIGGRLHRNDDDKGMNASNADQHEMDKMKDFREKFAIAEALAKTSEMTSTAQMKQRLAARQLEITNAAAVAAAAAVATNNVTANKDRLQKRQIKRARQRQRRREGGAPNKRRQQIQQQVQLKGVPSANNAPTHDAYTHYNNNRNININAIDTNDVQSNVDNNNDKHNNYQASADRYGGDTENSCSKDDERDDIRNDNENDNDSGSDSESDCEYGSDNDDDYDDDDDDYGVASTDTVATMKQQQQTQQENIACDYEPPRDLLLYLVRMGSFNSAPKINNVDSQDDSLEIPKGLNVTELLKHVKHLRGIDRPQLLTRYFVKPSLTTDVTDGLRSLKLSAVAKDYNVASTLPNHIRVLQWNILSQTLGQSNDGFVRCPEEALTWENRKFLIVQEILQFNPDIICLQEVDHFKFLQTILGTQNYDGIFFPKPDSPCLYIEENNGPDGCAIFYKRDKFELKNFDTRILEVWRVQSNQVAIVVNLAVKSSGKEFCVCTTHLKARHGSLLSKLRNEQGRDLLQFVKQFAGDLPVLICGDFNAEPTEPVYATVLGGKLMNLSSAYADIKTERDECNNDSGNELKASKELDSDADVQTTEEEETDGEQVCDDKVLKSIQREPPYTTWKIREDGEECHTIDYVFYTPEQFKVRNCLEFPRDDEVGKNRTPSFQYPSDHFSLVCDFEILDK